jgi:transposase InsO family protein
LKTKESHGICISLLCSLSGYSRQTYYKHLHHKEKSQVEGALIIQQVMDCRKVQKRLGTIKLLWLMAPFLKQHEISIGRDSMFTLLRLNGLLVGKGRSNKPRTTNSNHWMKKHPNLIEHLTPVMAGGLLVSDITFIGLSQGHSFLSLVTDAYSRKIVGFHLSERLTAAGPIAALEMAIESCSDTGGMIHHSDRGSQYCCSDYVEILQENNISISMTQSGDPKDNAIAERVNGILKSELLEDVYPNVQAARMAVSKAVNTYNYLRPHTSIDMLTPALAHSQVNQLKRHWTSPCQRKLKREASMRGNQT